RANGSRIASSTSPPFQATYATNGINKNPAKGRSPSRRSAAAEAGTPRRAKPVRTWGHTAFAFPAASFAPLTESHHRRANSRTSTAKPSRFREKLGHSAPAVKENCLPEFARKLAHMQQNGVLKWRVLTKPPKPHF